MSVENLLPLTPLSFEILLALADEPRHGYGIIKEIEARTGKPLKSSTGTLYLAIRRLDEQELIAESDAGEEVETRRRYYRLTELGREVVAAEAERLANLLGVARQKHMLSSKSLLAAAGPRKR
jgi:DNA-binding PadR family transcriptional regulator